MLLWTLLCFWTVLYLPTKLGGSSVDCSRSLSGTSGVLTSYNFPFDYRHNLSCTYRLVLGATTGQRTVCFTFKRFALERSTPFCSFDYIRFEHIKYCGNGLWQYGRQTTEPESNVWNKHFCWPAKKNHFDVTFLSDDNLNGAGFYAEYTVLPGPPPSPTDNVMDTGYAPCTDQQWTCFNRKCVNRTVLCDGKDDCGDGTDESYAHARCTEKSLLACDFSMDSVPSDGQCGFVQQDGQWFRTNKALAYGPSADHTNGTEGYFMYTDSDHSPAYLVSPEITLPLRPAQYCMSFWYYMYGRPAAAVLQVFLSRVDNYNRPEWERGNAEPNQWLQGQVTVQADTPLQVTFGAVLDNGFSGVALDDISVSPGPCNGDDISCSFESSLCVWKSVREVGGLHGNLTWELTNRLQSAAGPMEDHSSTDGSGRYLLVRTTPTLQTVHPRALLLSPPVSALSASMPRCLRFWYHLTGSKDDSAVLKVRLVLPAGQLSADRWAQNARFQAKWRRMVLQLAEDEPYQIMVEAILDGNSGQIALDEVVLEENACPDVDSGACVGGEFLCGDGSCVPAVHRCDGIPHCPDGADEDWRAACVLTTTVAPTTVCPQEYFRCVSDGRCVPVTWLCDDFRDCADGSDESHMAKCEGVSPRPASGSSSESPCGAGQFACSDGTCIQVAARCDGLRHCDDGSDEANCTHGAGDGTGTASVCGSAMFECATGGRCLAQTLVCDGQAHCADGSDEDSTSANCARPINTTGLGTTAAVALALSLVVVLIVIILPVVLCRRRKARQRRGERGATRPGTPDTTTPDISTISYGDDSSLNRPLEDSLRRSCNSSYRPGRRDGRLVNPVNEFQHHIEQMDDRRRQSCIENLERYMINPRRAQPLPPVPAGHNISQRHEDDLVDPNDYILALRSAPAGLNPNVVHPPPYSIRDYQNLQCTYVPPGSSTEGADAPSSSGVYSLPPDDPPPPYDGVKDADTNNAQTLPLRVTSSAPTGLSSLTNSNGVGSHSLPTFHTPATPEVGLGSEPPTRSVPTVRIAGVGTGFGVTPYHVSLVNHGRDNVLLDNTLISSHNTSLSNNNANISDHAPNHALLNHEHYPPHHNTSGHHSPALHYTPNHTPSTSSSYHTASSSLSPYHTPSNSISSHHSTSSQHPHHSSTLHQVPPSSRGESPRHHPIYPRLGTLHTSRTVSPHNHITNSPHVHPTASHHNATTPHHNATPHHASTVSPHRPQHKNSTAAHHTNPHKTAHHASHKNPAHHPHQQPASPHHPPRNGLPASHQLHQVQLQFLPSSSV